MDNHLQHLKIAKEVADRAGEGRAYGSLGNAYRRLGDFKQAIDYHMLGLTIAKEVGDRAEEGCAHGSLGNAYCSLGDFKEWATGLEKAAPTAISAMTIIVSVISNKP